MKAYRDETTGRWHSDLPDVFDLMCEKLRKREPFSFARYGDGEWNAIYGKKGHNCDGHEYFPDMGERLRKIVESKPKYLMGMQPLTVASERWAQIEKDFPGIDWVDGDSIHNASIDGKLPQLIDGLDSDTTVIIGPKHINNDLQYTDKLSFSWIGITIPSMNCWLEYETVVHELHQFLMDKRNCVILLCASMMSEILIDQFSEDGHTLIDMGSVLDPYAGVKSRRYHHKLNINAGLSSP